MVYLLQSGHQIHIKMVNWLRSEAMKAPDDLWAEVDCLREDAIETDHLSKEKAVEVEDLREKLRKEELSSMKLQAALALEKERRKKAKTKGSELKDQASKQILEAKIQTMEEFKVSFEGTRSRILQVNLETFLRSYSKNLNKLNIYLNKYINT